MMRSGDHGAAKAKDLRLLLQFSYDHLIAQEISTGQPRIFGPCVEAAGATDRWRRKIWRFEVGQDDDGAFLGSRWPEFTAACGGDEGWILIIRHRGGGLLTVKVFDSSRCLRELGAPPLAGDNLYSTSKSCIIVLDPSVRNPVS